MPETEEKRREAERRITDELGKQARTTPGDPEEEESKERRAQAEKDHRDTK